MFNIIFQIPLWFLGLPHVIFQNLAFFSWSALVILWIGHPPLSSPVALAGSKNHTVFSSLNIHQQFKKKKFGSILSNKIDFF